MDVDGGWADVGGIPLDADSDVDNGSTDESDGREDAGGASDTGSVDGFGVDGLESVSASSVCFGNVL